MLDSTKKGILYTLFLASLLINIVVFIWALTLPLANLHLFRQTQTAISAYWMLHGGGWWDYQTPVLGAPWFDPFEFPLFQWLVAKLAGMSGMHLDLAGQILSYAWLILLLWPVSSLYRSYSLPPATTLIFAILMLASPVYLFWGHAFLIETQALTLSFGMLALARGFFVHRKIWLALLAALIAAAAALTKITTAAPFLLLLLLMTIEALLADRLRSRQIATLAGAAMIGLLGPTLFYSWTVHADALKAFNPFTALHMSTAPAIRLWNFGTISQRFSSEFSRTVVRALVDVGGWLGPFLGFGASGLILLYYKVHRKVSIIFISLMTAWFMPFAVFTNLHIRHNYYQTGNAALLIAALAIVGGVASDKIKPGILLLVLMTIMTSQYSRFYAAFLPYMSADLGNDPRAIGLLLRNATPSGSAIVGTGFDWSPAMPYYAERKAVLIFDDINKARAQLASLPSLLGGLPLTAIAECPSPVLADPIARLTLAKISAGMRPRIEHGCTIWLKEVSMRPSRKVMLTTPR